MKIFQKSYVCVKPFSAARVYDGEPMNAATLPTSLAAAHQLIEQLQWRVAQLEKELFGPSSERQAEGRLSKAQILLSLFPPAEPAATQQVLVRLNEKETAPRVRRQPAARGWKPSRSGSSRPRRFVRAAARPSARLVARRANALNTFPPRSFVTKRFGRSWPVLVGKAG